MTAQTPPAPDERGVALLASAELVLIGRIMPASNQTWLARLGDDPDAPSAVYKPISGERPLWDFDEGTLAAREAAAALVSEALGWAVVPPTVLRDGPAGPGMAQLWCEPEEDCEPVMLAPAGRPAPGYLWVLDAEDQLGRPVSLTHEDCGPLRRMALFDVVVNNTDRKGGHVLAMPGGHRYGVDHGVCFHRDDKLRTVLWGWRGQRITASERDALERLAEDLEQGLGESLSLLITAAEIEATKSRLRRLLGAGRFPDPGDGWPALPWPAF